MEKKQVGIEINGSIFSNNGDINHDEFSEAFLQFIESKGWNFGGGTMQVDEDGEVIDDIKNVKTTPDTKHNWFEVNGAIRVEEKMTTKEFLEKLDEDGYEVLGSVGYSRTKDEDYE